MGIHVSSGGGGGVSLPTQTGNSGKFLKTDGSSTSWDDAGSAPDDASAIIASAIFGG